MLSLFVPAFADRGFFHFSFSNSLFEIADSYRAFDKRSSSIETLSRSVLSGSPYVSEFGPKCIHAVTLPKMSFVIRTSQIFWLGSHAVHFIDYTPRCFAYHMYGTHNNK